MSDSLPQLFNSKNRASAKADRDLKKSLQKEIPSNFNVMVYIDFERESTKPKDDVAQFNINRPNDSSNYRFVRARSAIEHHEHMVDPLDIRDKKKQEVLINSCFEASIRIDHPDISQLLNGSIWNCSYLGGEFVQLNSLVRPAAFSLLNTNARILNPNSLFITGDKQKVPDNASVINGFAKVKYAGPNQIEKVKIYPNYQTFLQKLSDELEKISFSKVVTVNSLYRDHNDQARAMVYSRGRWPLDAFKLWYNETYLGVKNPLSSAPAGLNSSSAVKKETSTLVHRSQGFSSREQLYSELANLFRDQMSRGLYISNHMRSSAIDLNTSDLSYNEVMILKSVLNTMGSYVENYNWEGVDGDQERVLKRARGEVPNLPGEHIHLKLTNNANWEKSTGTEE